MYFQTSYQTKQLLLMIETLLGWMKIMKNKINEKKRMEKAVNISYISNLYQLSCLKWFKKKKRQKKYNEQLAKKLNHSQTNSKIHWSILKYLYNGNKITFIIPLLINEILVSDFSEKAKSKSKSFQWLLSVTMYCSHNWLWRSLK